MNSSPLNGSFHLDGHSNQSATRSTRSIQLPTFSPSRRNRADGLPVVSFQVYKAQRRRATLAAQAAARRRTVAAAVLCVLGLVAGAVTLEREFWLQQQQQQVLGR
jgi:hypothetical protein